MNKKIKNALGEILKEKYKSGDTPVIKIDDIDKIFPDVEEEVTE